MAKAREPRGAGAREGEARGSEARGGERSRRRASGRIPLEMPPEFKCYGCSAGNRYGLQLAFERSGSRVIGHFDPAAHLQGWFGMVHAGLLATLLDELGAWSVAGLCQRIGVTRDLSVHFRRPLYIEEPILLEGEIAEDKPNLITVNGRLLNQRGDIGVEGEIKVFPLEAPQFAKMVPGGQIPASLLGFFPSRR